MRIAVTGGNGHLGQALVRQLRERGHAVRILDRNATEDGCEGWESCRVDVTDPSSLAGSLEGCDVVVHLAAILEAGGHPERFEQVNHRGTCNVRDEAVRAGVRRFVLVSSISVTYRDGNPYSRSKQDAEACLAGCGLAEILILRPTLVVCDGGAQEFASFARIVRRLPLLPLPRGGMARKRPVHADDLARGIVLACDAAVPARATLALGGSASVTLAEMARAIRRRMGKQLVMVPVPHWLAHLTARLSEALPAWCGTSRFWNRQILSGLLEDADPSIEAAQAALGWMPRGFDEFLATTRLPGDLA